MGIVWELVSTARQQISRASLYSNGGFFLGYRLGVPE